MATNDVFTMLTGESDRTLRVGMILPARAVKVREHQVFFRLDSGLDGYMPAAVLGPQRIVDIVQEG